MSAFGPRLTAMGSLLHGRYRLSMRETAGVLDDLLSVPVGIGSVSGLCREVSEAVAEPYEAVRDAVHQQDIVNVDETGWKQAGERRWLWVAVTTLGSLFLVAKSRSKGVLTTLLGEDFAGIVGSDRYRAYLSIPSERRQLYWAHLKRNFAAFAEHGGAVGDWGKEGIGFVAQTFEAWHRFKEGKSNRSGLQAQVAVIRKEFRAFLERGTEVPSWHVRGLSADLLKLEAALWTFARVEEVEPTNNSAERALRPAVLWRKGCFGADSSEGNQFVARILTGAVIAYRLGQSAPALLPVP